ncbi:MAG: ion transporter [Candidatus Saccharibacteria bacterium]
MKNHHKQKLFLLKELSLGIMAIASIGLVLYEFIGNPSETRIITIQHLDFWIAIAFLVDFTISLIITRDRQKYVRRNWYFLLAAIPLTDAIAESLRGIRVLRLIRLIRAGEHLGFEQSETKRKR